MRKIIMQINSFLFLAAVFTGGVAFFCTPKQSLSNEENRTLMSFPVFNFNTVFSGKFEKGFEEYYNDHFPFREVWINFVSTLNTLKGIQDQEIRVVNVATAAHSSELDNITDEQAPDEVIPDEVIPEESNEVVELIEDPNALEEGTTQHHINTDTLMQEKPLEPVVAEKEEAFSENDVMRTEFSKIKGVVVVKGRVLQVFAGSKHSIAPYANMLNEYRRKLPQSVKIYAMLAPSGSDFYLPYQVNKGVLKEKENIQIFNSLISPDIISIDAYNELAKHREKYIQFRTDHHWTALGAYYAYTAFAKEAGFTPLALNEMQLVKKELSFLGSLYNYTKDVQLKNNPDFLEYYKLPTVSKIITSQHKGHKENPNLSLYMEKSNSYLLFLGGDYPFMHIQTENGKNRNILVIKDSFGNALIPYLTSHYNNIYVVDYRYFKESIPDLIKKQNIGELLYLHNTFAANSNAARKFGLSMLNGGTKNEKTQK